jgi:hypothetical protein
MIADYLDHDDAFALSGRLKAEGVNPVTKRHGLPRIFGVDSNYKVFVDRTLFDTAQGITKQFLIDCEKKRAEAMVLLTTRCPGCQSRQIVKKEKTSLLQKIRFFGVTVWKCTACGGEWYT